MIGTISNRFDVVLTPRDAHFDAAALKFSACAAALARLTGTARATFIPYAKLASVRRTYGGRWHPTRCYAKIGRHCRYNRREFRQPEISKGLLHARIACRVGLEK